jgi:hypothetical protein
MWCSKCREIFPLREARGLSGEAGRLREEIAQFEPRQTDIGFSRNLRDNPRDGTATVVAMPPPPLIKGELFLDCRWLRGTV